MRATYVDESPYTPGKYIIHFKNGILPYGKIEGNYHVFGARLMGLSYANYLRYCRDVFGAEIMGKGHKYPVPYFKTEKDAEELAAILEERIFILIKEKMN